MTKTYFTKYLPVEGEIKWGDYFKSKGNIFRHILNKDKDGNLHKNYKDAKLVKLFLCSRDIQVGDKFFSYADNYTTEFIADEFTFDADRGYNKDYHTNKWFKIIGEVPPSLGLKEGEEFTIKEAKALGILD